MKPYRVEMLVDYHGVSASVYTQTQALLEILKRQSPNEKLVVLHEALTCDNHAMRDFFDHNISTHALMDYSFRSWGPAESYRNLLNIISENNLQLEGLDHELIDRKSLCKEFGSLMRMFEDTKSEEKERPFFNRLKYVLTWDRERGFAERVDVRRNHGYTTAVVVTSRNHQRRLEPFFRFTQGYDVNVQELDPAVEEELGKQEEEINLGYAKEHEVRKMNYPPLVPIVVEAFSEIK